MKVAPQQSSRGQPSDVVDAASPSKHSGMSARQKAVLDSAMAGRLQLYPRGYATSKSGPFHSRRTVLALARGLIVIRHDPLLALALTLAALAPAGAQTAAPQTANRLYVMDCGHNSAKDQSIWSPGINVGKPIEQADTCSLIKHGSQWLLWDTGYPDAITDAPVDTPVGHATRAKALMGQLAEIGVERGDIAFVAASHTNVQAAAGPHCPVASHVSTMLAEPLQRVIPGLHLPAHVPPTHTFAQGSCALLVPVSSQR